MVPLLNYAGDYFIVADPNIMCFHFNKHISVRTKQILLNHRLVVVIELALNRAKCKLQNAGTIY